MKKEIRGRLGIADSYLAIARDAEIRRSKTQDMAERAAFTEIAKHYREEAQRHLLARRVAGDAVIHVG